MYPCDDIIHSSPQEHKNNAVLYIGHDTGAKGHKKSCYYRKQLHCPTPWQEQIWGGLP